MDTKGVKCCEHLFPLGAEARGSAHAAYLELRDGRHLLVCRKVIPYGKDMLSYGKAFAAVQAAKGYASSPQSARYIGHTHNDRKREFQLFTELCAGGSLQEYLVRSVHPPRPRALLPRPLPEATDIHASPPARLATWRARLASALPSRVVPLFSAPLRQVKAQVYKALGSGLLGPEWHRQPLLPEPVVFTVAHALLHELARLHAAGMLHRDLRPESVLLDLERRPRLGSWAQARRAPASGPAYRRGYMAPEVPLPGEACYVPYGPPADVFALGRTLLACAVHPGHRDAAWLALVRGGAPEGMDGELASLLRGLVQPEPEQRLTAAEALAHPFIAARACEHGEDRLPDLCDE